MQLTNTMDHRGMACRHHCMPFCVATRHNKFPRCIFQTDVIHIMPVVTVVCHAEISKLQTVLFHKRIRCLELLTNSLLYLVSGGLKLTSIFKTLSTLFLSLSLSPIASHCLSHTQYRQSLVFFWKPNPGRT